MGELRAANASTLTCWPVRSDAGWAACSERRGIDAEAGTQAEQGSTARWQSVAGSS